MLLAESSDDEQVNPEGPFSLVEPRHRLQLDATAQLGCVFGQLAVQRREGPGGRLLVLGWQRNQLASR